MLTAAEIASNIYSKWRKHESCHYHYIGHFYLIKKFVLWERQWQTRTHPQEDGIVKPLETAFSETAEELN